MNKLLRFLVGFLVPGLMLAFATMNPAMAQAKAKAAAPKVVLKVLFENEKVRAFEARFKPGAEGENVDRPASVIRALKGGTIQRIYPDGKKGKHRVENRGSEMATGEDGVRAKEHRKI